MTGTKSDISRQLNDIFVRPARISHESASVLSSSKF